MSKQSRTDLYAINDDQVLAPPAGFWQRMRFIGPGLILTASVVGSGELIATTLLGAKAGFVALWVILVSCLVKVLVQIEFGKCAIYSGQTTMEVFNRLPGFKIGKAGWAIWAWLLLMLPKMLQVGAIVGSIALVLNITFPAIPTRLFVWPIALVAAVLVWKGGYRLIEKTCVGLILLFTLFSIASLVALQFTEYAIAMSDITFGLGFQLPREFIPVALGAFGITGIGGDEIMAYNYWLIEKGYASKSGVPKETPEWRERAKGWIRIMQFDAVISMIVYTSVTIVFYLLGAAVLNGSSELPEKSNLISTLSLMYTETLGGWASSVFLAGAFFVLFSTLLAALGAWTRMFTDAFGQIGLVDFKNPVSRNKVIAALAFGLPLIWSVAFLFYKDPAFMIIVGGIATTFILFIVAFAAGWMRYKFLPVELKPSKIYDVFLWLSLLAIAGVGVYIAVRTFS